RGTSVTMRQLQQEVTRVAQFQIDSVNVCVRAHYTPLYSRLGNYNPALLDQAFSTAPRRLFEYWGHAASLIDVNLEPMLRWRRERAQIEAWGMMKRIQAEQPDLVTYVYERICERPATARELQQELGKEKSHWGWNWSAEKAALEWLFFTGSVTSAGRTSQFERIYDTTERALPATIVATPTPEPAVAIRSLISTSARALGIATDRCLADYFRIPMKLAQPAIADLIDAGELIPTQVQGWDRKTYRWHEATCPRHLNANALVSPFDSLVFERRRLEELFGVRYRIGIYTPKAQRSEGYYVYLFVCDDEIAARVDLKADRARGVLSVQGAWRDSDRRDLVERLAAELHEMAQWLGLGAIDVAPVGNLAAELQRGLVSAPQNLG
ncbi:MAG: winged helix-turn-helix domain-containing protein, partial [Propionibacteriaceae bacterium]